MKRRIPIICITTVAVASVGLAIALIPQGCTQSTDAAQSPQQNKIAYGIGFYLGEEVRSGLEAALRETKLPVVGQPARPRKAGPPSICRGWPPATR